MALISFPSSYAEGRKTAEVGFLNNGVRKESMQKAPRLSRVLLLPVGYRAEGDD